MTKVTDEALQGAFVVLARARGIFAGEIARGPECGLKVRAPALNASTLQHFNTSTLQHFTEA